MKMHIIDCFKLSRLHFIVAGLLLFAANSFAGENSNTTKFSTATAGNFVWWDKDADGVQDINEPGLEGITVVLNDQLGNIVTTTLTDATGFYTFTGINAGATGKTFQIWFKQPVGFQFSPRNGSIAATGNSDADEQTGNTSLFTLQPGEINNDIDAGLISLTNTTLPLHTLQLSAQLKGATVSLNWIAENEMNTDQFVIQRSVDGVNYQTIGFKAVIGQVNTPTAYNFTDDIRLLNNNSAIYYRIKAEDNVGRFAYSNIAPIRLNKFAGIKAWPNPFVSDIRITYDGSSSSVVYVQLTDNFGKTIWASSFEVSRGLNQLSITGMDNLAAGIYLVRVMDRSTDQIFIERVIKQ